LLAAEQITVQFGATRALDGVDFAILPGRIHALVGENGAGKSTLMRVMAGAITPVSGRILVNGRPVRFQSPRDAQRSGVRLIHQELSLVPALTVAETIGLGTEPHRRGIVDRRRLRERARRALELIGERLDIDSRVGNLSLAQRELVEIAKALAGRVQGAEVGRLSDSRTTAVGAPLQVLLLDEPTAILSTREADTLFQCLRTLTLDGVGIVYCSHRLDEIEAIADEVVVLRDGRCVSRAPARAVPRDRLISLMVGREVAVRPPRVPASVARVEVLRVERMSTTGARDVSFAMSAGEIVALVGLVGSGRSELARALIGDNARTSGSMLLNGQTVTIHSPAEASRHGVGYVPEDRQRSGLIPDASARANLTLARLETFARGRTPILDRARERGVAQRWIERLRVKTATVESPVSRLSGGNQQKLVVGRWLLPGKRPLQLLIVDEPTRGVDVGARAELYDVLTGLADSGIGVLVITSDLEEARSLADRLLVMCEGRLVAGLPATASAPEVASHMIPGPPLDGAVA
jgi:ABC-type sugar transport system ATPase subunit